MKKNLDRLWTIAIVLMWVSLLIGSFAEKDGAVHKYAWQVWAYSVVLWVEWALLSIGLSLFRASKRPEGEDQG